VIVQSVLQMPEHAVTYPWRAKALALDCQKGNFVERIDLPQSAVEF
jgi:hypothetical protein